MGGNKKTPCIDNFFSNCKWRRNNSTLDAQMKITVKTNVVLTTTFTLAERAERKWNKEKKKLKPRQRNLNIE